jgi:hypothetical protein
VTRRPTRCVWLPLRFDGEMAYIDWHDEWRVEAFASNGKVS